MHPLRELFTTYGERIVDVVHGTDRQDDFFYSARNDVLMPTSDVTPNGLATASCIRRENVILGGDILVIRASEDVLDGEFLAYAIKADRSQVMKLVNGTTVYHLYGRDMANFCFSTPGVKEQRVIAQALSDVDELIGQLDVLIAKKQDIKRATMRQLLTGETRLAGFSEPWDANSMGRLGFIYGGLSGKQKDDFGNGDARYVTFMGIMANTLIRRDHVERVRVKPGESQNRVLKGDLLFNATSETPNELAMGAVMDEEVDDLYLNSFCFGFRIHDPESCYPLYLAYFFRDSAGRSIVSSLAQGATRYNLSKTQFLSLELSMPGYREQREIAHILRDMDAEIVALEQRRDKTLAIKQGMIQELLTGHTRLI